MTQLIKSDLANYQTAIADLDPHRKTPPPISSIMVTETTGERAVISINAVKTQVNHTSVPIDIFPNFNIVLIDGHQPLIGSLIAQKAKNQNIPVVIDGGSWKPGFTEILPFVDYAICSANFQPPNCETEAEVLTYLHNFGIPHIAITHGEKPIRYFTKNDTGYIDVPKIQAKDTLGAGDIFHGAFCHYILQQDFREALSLAAKIATNSCQFFGTRRWMHLD